MTVFIMKVSCLLALLAMVYLSECALTITNLPTTLTIPENTATSSVIFTVHVNLTNQNSSIIFSFNSGNSDSLFKIDKDNGQIFLSKNLDYETKKNYTLLVKALNATSTSSDQKYLYVNITDINDNAPVCYPRDVIGELEENATAGSTFTSLSCTDIDTGDGGRVEHEVIEGDMDVIAVNITTGAATIKRTVDYVSEKKPIYQVIVKVKDLGVPSLSVNVTVKLSTNYGYEPTVVQFTANGGGSIEVDHNTAVTFYCQVQSNVPARARLTSGTGLGRVREWISTNESISLTLNNLTCEDSGRFFCSGMNGYEKNDSKTWQYLDINIKCALKPKDPAVVTRPNTIQVSPQKDTVFTLEFYGYPVPTNFSLKIETGRGQKDDVDKNRYSMTYIPLVPPVGLLNVTIYDANTSGTTTYYVSVKNEVGAEVELRLDVVKEDHVVQVPVAEKDSNDVAIGVGVGVTCGVIIIVVGVVVAVYFVRRNRAVQRDARFQTAATIPTVPNQYGNERVYDHIEDQPYELANPVFDKH